MLEGFPWHLRFLQTPYRLFFHQISIIVCLTETRCQVCMDPSVRRGIQLYLGPHHKSGFIDFSRFDKPFILQIDAPQSRLGFGIASHNVQWQSFIKCRTRYAPSNRELLGIFYTMRKRKIYLLEHQYVMLLTISCSGPLRHGNFFKGTKINTALV